MPDNLEAKIISRRRGYNGHFKIDVLDIERGLFQGGTDRIVREVFERGDAVAVIPYDPVKDMIVIGREMRAGILQAGENPYTFALVAGGMNAGESAIEAAKRETLEEAALELRDAHLTHDRLYCSAGGTSERVSIVFGIVSAPSVGAILGLASEKENIHRYSLPVRQFFGMVGSREMPDMMTRLGADWLKKHRPAIRKAYAPAKG